MMTTTTMTTRKRRRRRARSAGDRLGRHRLVVAVAAVDAAATSKICRRTLRSCRSSCKSCSTWCWNTLTPRTRPWTRKTAEFLAHRSTLCPRRRTIRNTTRFVLRRHSEMQVEIGPLCSSLLRTTITRFALAHTAHSFACSSLIASSTAFANSLDHALAFHFHTRLGRLNSLT